MFSKGKLSSIEERQRQWGSTTLAAAPESMDFAVPELPTL